MNKYIRILLGLLILYFVGESIYSEIQKDKTPGKAKRLSCQKKVTSFERGISNPDILYAQNLIEHGNVDFTSTVEKAIYSKSKLFEYISLAKMDDIFYNKLKSYVKYNEKNQEKYKLSYYIYENDKNDPGKKTPKSKLYAGYVVLEVKDLNNKNIYKVQIDFMDDKGSDIKETLDCTIESFMTYNK